MIISLLVIGAVACGAVYMALTAGPVVVKRTDSAPPSRTLAYEEKINRGDDAPPPAPEEAAPEQQASAPVEQPQAAAPTPEGADENSQMAALPHSGEVTVTEPGALPWQRPDPMQGEGPDAGMPDNGPEAYDPNAAPSGEAYPPYPTAARPGEDADPNAYPPGPEDEPQEWVQVLVSGAGMHGAASEDAPALFAFPYGRALRVVSRYEGWVEVTDPQSAATGWMKTQYLAPIATPGARPESEAMYQDEPPRRRGWFRRNGGDGGGLADMINRALGGR